MLLASHLWPSAEKRTDISITVVIANCHRCWVLLTVSFYDCCIHHVIHWCWVLVSTTFSGCGCMLLTVVAPAKILPRFWVLVTPSAVVTELVTDKALNVAFILRIYSGLRGFRPSVWSLRGPPVQEGVFKLFVYGSFGPPGWCFIRPTGQERWLTDSSVANWTRGMILLLWSS
ncbi:hypothetical protein Dimus_012871 [Dionaea muscipula]